MIPSYILSQQNGQEVKDSTETFQEKAKRKSSELYQDMKIDPKSAFPPKVDENQDDDTGKNLDKIKIL